MISILMIIDIHDESMPVDCCFCIIAYRLLLVLCFCRWIGFLAKGLLGQQARNHSNLSLYIYIYIHMYIYIYIYIYVYTYI